ncbi:hypothetical protein [Bacillus sp. B-jedd]|uniref:hypothetical protein n=1 Tax=Bacillus sp. B-jedd TaxID=1476857 RepID=UPI0005155B01|nr:hypothetical protein [Bacillus sp. B-jedd]CEG27153.1 sporulation protein YhcO/YhcP [Bacillus sp. B-jedd]
MKLLFKRGIKIILIIISSMAFIFTSLFLVAVYDVSKENDIEVLQTIKTVISSYIDNPGKIDKLKQQSLKDEVRHITIYYNSTLKDILPLTKETLEDAEQLTKKYLGYEENSPVDLIFMDMKELKNFSAIENLSGFYSDIDKVIAIGINQEEVGSIIEKRDNPFYLFQNNILHEYAHYATFSKLEVLDIQSSIVPKWFIEGVATYIGENEVQLDYLSFKPNFIKLEKLETNPQWEKALDEEGRNPYYQCYFTIAFLIHTYGDNVISTLLDETSTSKNFEASFQKVTGKKIDELETDIVRYYEKQ